ncbi:MAG: hypothetical protein QGG71_26235 [Pirellulaceae bacterium]|jgi:hypothetical protein|nr:hypothetical protein [Pirellulaceae bacterium]
MFTRLTGLRQGGISQAGHLVVVTEAADCRPASFAVVAGWKTLAVNTHWEIPGHIGCVPARFRSIPKPRNRHQDPKERTTLAFRKKSGLCVPFVASSTVAPDLLVGANASHVIPEAKCVRLKS